MRSNTEGECKVVDALNHFGRLSEQVRDGSASRDTRCRETSDKCHNRLFVCSVCRERECSGIALPVRAESDVLQELGPGLGISDAARRVCRVVSGPGYVIQEVLQFSGFGPDTEADVSVLR